MTVLNGVQECCAEDKRLYHLGIGPQQSERRSPCCSTSLYIHDYRFSEGQTPRLHAEQVHVQCDHGQGAIRDLSGQAQREDFYPRGQYSDPDTWFHALFTGQHLSVVSDGTGSWWLLDHRGSVSKRTIKISGGGEDRYSKEGIYVDDARNKRKHGARLPFEVNVSNTALLSLSLGIEQYIRESRAARPRQAFSHTRPVSPAAFWLAIMSTTPERQVVFNSSGCTCNPDTTRGSMQSVGALMRTLRADLRVD